MKKFISVNDVDNLSEWMETAKEFKANPYSKSDFGKNKTIALLFLNPSLRTRLSTQKAAQNLGFNVMVVNLNNDGWQIEMEDGTIMDQGTQEHIKEAAGVVSQYCDLIGIRTFPSLENKEDDYNELIMTKFIANAQVPVLSLESATLHPLQSFADLITIDEFKKKDKPKVVLTWAPHPRRLPQCVANSFCQWIKETDAEFVITNPPGFDLAPEFVGDTPVIHDQDEALKDADFVYTKNWSSYEDYGKIGEGLNDWEITKAKMDLTNNGKFMHCLPVRRNVVVSDDVLDSDSSVVLNQANNRTFSAQTAIYKLLK